MVIQLLTWYQKKHGNNPLNLTSLVRKGMPANQGERENSSFKRKKRPEIEMLERTKRTCNISNNDRFFIKKITTRIQVCQGYRHSFNPDNQVPLPPRNYCIARKELRPYHDKSGNLKYHQKSQMFIITWIWFALDLLIQHSIFLNF